VIRVIIYTGWKTLSILVLLCLTVQAGDGEPVVGTVKTAHGGTDVRRGADTVPIHEGTHLLLNDTLRTAADGSLGVILQDGTRISLGPNTELKIDKFLYQPADGKFGLLLQLARGVLAYASGKIAQFSPETIRIETPVGVLGLRGTHFAVSVEGN
jgi:hypothetical protein